MMDASISWFWNISGEGFAWRQFQHIPGRHLSDPSNTADAGWYTDPDYEMPSEDKTLREDVLKNELRFDHLEKSDQLQDPVIPESWMRKREYHLL